MQYLNSMEKSMVQELSVLTHSTVFSSRPSFLLPTDPDRLELRRSRIQNLPGYRKEDLSNKLNFVVVFQTIEIERLSQEIETLRIMAKDAERQRLNFQNYEVQIRELTERCHAYQLHREGQEDELARMRDFCERMMEQMQQQRRGRDDGLKEKYQQERMRGEQLQAEVDRWRNRYAGLEISRSKELEEVRLEFENRRRSQINRQTRELAIKHENELAVLSSDLRKAREESQLRMGEVGRLEELLGKFRIREEEMQEIEEKMYEYQNKFVLLSQENYRLNELIRRRNDDLERVRRSQKQLKTRVESKSNQEEELERLRGQLQGKRQAIDQLQRMLRSSAESNEKLTLQCQKAQGYEQLIDELEVELQRLNGIMRDKINESDSIKNSHRLLESKLAAAGTATQKEFAAYEQRIVNFTREQERLNAQLRHRLAEGEQLKARCVELEKLGSCNDALRQENEGLRSQLGQYNNKIEEFKRKIKIQEDNLLIMEDIEQKLKLQEQTKRELITDRERLSATVRELTLRAETSAQKAQAAQESLTKLTGVEGELTECKQRLAWMTQELDRINNEIQMRVAELQQLRENYRSLGNSKATYQGIEQRLVQNLAQMEKLVLDLDSNRRENDRLQNDNMNMELSIKGLQGQLIALADEREDANRTINAQTLEIHELRQKVEYYSSEGKAKQQLQQQLQEQQKKMDNYKNLYAQMEQRLNKETAQSQAMVYELMQIRSQPRVSKELAEELITVRRQADEQQNVIRMLFQRLETIQAILSAVRQSYAAQIQDFNAFRQRLSLLSVKANSIDDIYSLFNGYSEKIDNLREENFKLESEKALAGIEVCESMKVVQEASVTPPQPSIKNSSIAFKVSTQELASREEDNNYLFTFKEVHRQQSLEEPDLIKERTETEENEAGHSPEEGSMASSFINTLITKESVARFDLKPQQESENSTFGININSKLRYGGNGYEMRYQRDEYLPIEREIENLPTQINRAVSPVHQRGGFFESAGIKRVTSYTHFAPTLIQCPGSPLDPSPALRVPAFSQSPNTVNSTSESSSHLGKRIRIPADPARLILYRQH